MSGFVTQVSRDLILLVPFCLDGASSKITTIRKQKRTGNFMKFIDKLKLLKQRIFCLQKDPRGCPSQRKQAAAYIRSEHHAQHKWYRIYVEGLFIPRLILAKEVLCWADQSQRRVTPSSINTATFFIDRTVEQCHFKHFNVRFFVR